jgi:hypothetical protein
MTGRAGCAEAGAARLMPRTSTTAVHARTRRTMTMILRIEDMVGPFRRTVP